MSSAARSTAALLTPGPLCAAPEEGTRRFTYLHPGQIFASKEPFTITTVLGSCVSVCLFDPFAGVGGMNHFLLPSDPGTRNVSPRFGNHAMDMLLDDVMRLGADRSRLQAKLFGGACVMHAFLGRESLGDKNVAIAQSRLARHGLALVAHDFGGQRGRKLIFHTDDGTAWVRTL